jgi:rod shape-determining protein MreC
MEYGPPPLFNQGVSARARLAFFSFLAVALIVIDARVKVLETMRVGVGVVLYPLQQVMLLPRAAAERIGAYFTSVAQLQRENQQLKLGALDQSRELQTLTPLRAENEQLRRLLGARERTAAPGLLAEIVYESRDRFARKIVINKGGADGIKAGQPVLDAQGVIGQVTRVLPAVAEVTLLTDKDHSIAVQVLRNGLRGVMFGGTEAGTLDLRFMAVNADVVNGDDLVTSGLDGVYPAGLPVARVSKVERDAKDQFARITATPAAGVHQQTFLLVLQVEGQAPPVLPRTETEGGRRVGKGAKK